MVLFALTCEAPAVFVSLESSIAGDFSKNCITIAPWDRQRMTFIAEADVTTADCERELRMQSLFTKVDDP